VFPFTSFPFPLVFFFFGSMSVTRHLSNYGSNPTSKKAMFLSGGESSPVPFDSQSFFGPFPLPPSFRFSNFGKFQNPPSDGPPNPLHVLLPGSETLRPKRYLQLPSPSPGVVCLRSLLFYWSFRTNWSNWCHTAGTRIRYHHSQPSRNADSTPPPPQRFLPTRSHDSL